ncbi:DUF3813 family protein [Priestia aryabhattai]|uniref:DUF3813 family protein n=1 Tax=Priestia aryabhattai TaxID=412384 RepID=UPI001FB250F0|nr:DUF3813 family protein [Priestia aryabhattai]
MKNSLFGQVKDAIRNAVSGHSEDQLHRQKHGNGELDISEGVLNSIASNASPEEQEQLKQFQNSLHQAYDTDGESHEREKSADITSDTLSHIVQNASSEEKAQLQQLQSTLEGGQSHAHGEAHTSSENVAADMLSHAQQSASPEEQAQLQQLQNTLGAAGQNHQTSQAHTSAASDENIAADMLSHAQQNASPEEQAQLQELSNDLKGTH